MTTAKEFVEFWLQNSVHADEQLRVHRGREAVQRLADNLVRAAEFEGFTKEQMKEELGGDIFAYIRASIDRQNAAEQTRLRNEPDFPEAKPRRGGGTGGARTE